MLFPKGTDLYPKEIVSEIPAIGKLLAVQIYHLPLPGLLEIHLWRKSARTGEPETREMNIPLEEPFLYAQVRNTDPAFQKKYRDFSHCSDHGNWANEYGDQPVGWSVEIVG